MKHFIVIAMLMGMAGCTSTPLDVKATPVAKTIHTETSYKMLGSCLQQKLQNEAGHWAEMRLTFQDWMPSAELTYLQQINLAGFVETVYVITLEPKENQTTLLSLRLNKGLFESAVKKNLSDIENAVKTCESLIKNAPQS